MSNDDWVKAIVTYGPLLEGLQPLHSAWVNGDRSETSVTDFDELYEQIYDDLDSEEMFRRVAADSSAPRRLITTIGRFLDQLGRCNRAVEEREEMRDPDILLRSEEWTQLRRASLALAEAGASLGYVASEGSR